MEISPATPKDLPRIKELITALSAFHDDTAPVTLERLQDLFFGPHHSTALVARSGGQIVGYAGLNRVPTLHTGALRMDIHHLYVVEPFRARGVGKALIDHARNTACVEGIEVLTIGTDPNNKAAQAAYRGMGLEEITNSGPRFRIPLVDTVA